MPDFTTLVLETNTGTEASPTWTGAAFNASGTITGIGETRFCTAGAGGASIASASWPNMNRPVSPIVAGEAWIYPTAEASGGVKLGTYPTLPGSTANAKVARWRWSSDGQFTSKPQFTCFADFNHATPVPGQQTTQTGAGGPLINGQASDTGTGTPSSSTSYVKANAYGYGVDGAGAQQTPAANSLTTPVASTDGAAGGVAPLANAWIPTHWQSLQGWIQYIVNGIVPAQAAGQWFWSVLAYIGPNMLTGQFTWVATLQYNYT